MGLMKHMIIVVLATTVVYAKQMKQPVQQRVPAGASRQVRVPVERVKESKEWVQPDINKLPEPLNVIKIKPEEYLQSKVASASQQLVSDIFPKEDTIERILFEFKDQFPGPNKQADTTMLYNAIINNPEIKKHTTLKNAVPVYNFIREALSKAWDKKDDLVWAG